MQQPDNSLLLDDAHSSTEGTSLNSSLGYPSTENNVSTIGSQEGMMNDTAPDGGADGAIAPLPAPPSDIPLLIQPFPIEELPFEVRPEPNAVPNHSQALESTSTASMLNASAVELGPSSGHSSKNGRGDLLVEEGYVLVSDEQSLIPPFLLPYPIEEPAFVVQPELSAPSGSVPPSSLQPSDRSPTAGQTLNLSAPSENTLPNEISPEVSLTAL